MAHFKALFQLDKLRETMKNLRQCSLQVEIQTWDIQNKKQEC